MKYFILIVISISLNMTTINGCPISYRSNYLEVTNGEYKVVSWYYVDSSNIEGYREFLKTNKSMFDSSNVYSKTILISCKTNDTIFSVSNIFCQQLTIYNQYIICASTLNNCFNQFNLVVIDLQGRVMHAESFEPTGLLVTEKNLKVIRKDYNSIIFTSDSLNSNIIRLKNVIWIPLGSKANYSILNKLWYHGVISLNPKLGNTKFSQNMHGGPIYWYAETNANMKVKRRQRDGVFVFSYNDFAGKRCKWKIKNACQF